MVTAWHWRAAQSSPAPGALPTNGKGTGVIIPNKIVALITKLKAAELELRADDKVIEVRADDLLIASKLIAGTFPDYPQDHPREIQQRRRA